MTDLQVGDRIELVSMTDDPDPIEPGTQGTVNWIGEPFQGHDQIGVKWDDGRTLGLTVPPDRYRIIEKGTGVGVEASIKQVFAEEAPAPAGHEMTVGEYRVVFTDVNDWFEPDAPEGDFKVFKGDQEVGQGQLEGDPGGSYYAYLILEQVNPADPRFTRTIVDQWADQRYDDRSFTGIAYAEDLESELSRYLAELG